MKRRPEHLRAIEGISVTELANRLALGTQDLLHLERTNLRLWEVASLVDYLAALGYRLELVAVAKDGTREEIELPGATP